MSVRIMAKKAYEFVNPNAPESIRRVRVEPFIVATVPDWVPQDDLFKLAHRNGNAEVMGNTTNDISISDIEALKEKAKALGIKNYQNMRLETLRQKIADAGTIDSGKVAGDSDNQNLDEMSLAELTLLAEKNHVDIAGYTSEDDIRARIKDAASQD